MNCANDVAIMMKTCDGLLLSMEIMHSEIQTLALTLTGSRQQIPICWNKPLNHANDVDVVETVMYIACNLHNSATNKMAACTWIEILYQCMKELYRASEDLVFQNQLLSMQQTLSLK